MRTRNVRVVTIKKFLGNFGGVAPTLSIDQKVYEGDIAIDIGVLPVNIWQCLKNTSGAPVWSKGGTGDKTSPPTSSSAPGTEGQWALSGGYYYKCTATNEWIRWAVETSFEDVSSSSSSNSSSSSSSTSSSSTSSSSTSSNSSSSSPSSPSSSSAEFVVLDNGGSYSAPVGVLAPIHVKFTGTPGQTATVTLNTSYNYTVGNVGGSFVWDIGGANEHTFTAIGESIVQEAGAIGYTIQYDGTGSLLFNLQKLTTEMSSSSSSSSPSSNSSSSNSSSSSSNSSSSSTSSSSNSSPSSLSSSSSSSSSTSSSSESGGGSTPGYTVAGGSSYINGTYCLSGTVNGKNRYLKSTNDYHIVWCANYWWMALTEYTTIDDLGGYACAYAPGTGATPPTQEPAGYIWSANIGCGGNIQEGSVTATTC